MSANRQSKSSPVSVIYFGNDWFAENRTSSHHVAQRLGGQLPLLYVDVPGLRRPQATARDLRKLWRKLTSAARLPRPVAPHMWHMVLPQIPFRRWAAVRFLNHRLSLALVRRAIRHLGFDAPVSWFVVPHAGFLAGRMGERLIVYYCIDNYSALPDVDPVAVARMDDDLTARADLVFAASPTLAENKALSNANVVYSPHGVDIELFERAADPSLPAAPRAASLRHPVVGFFGVLDGRIDVPLLARMAGEHPEWTLLLVGRIATECGHLQNCRNVILTGAVPYKDLPDWARVFDVCLMPYLKDAFSANANPLKLREYLATGKPVVSVPIPEVDRFAEHVRVAGDAQSFIRAVEESLATDSDASRAARRRAVAGMSWDARVAEVMSIVRQRLERPSGWRKVPPQGPGKSR